MTLEEAEKILNSVRHETYPPTNLYVLLEAAQTIYRTPTSKDTRRGIKDILEWALQVFERNG